MLTGIMAEYICERNDIMETDNILIPRCFEREFVQKGAFLKSALFWAGYIENFFQKCDTRKRHFLYPDL